MDRQARKQIKEILKKHGYSKFSPDPRVVRVHVSQAYGEGLAVHPNEGGTYTLWVRRNKKFDKFGSAPDLAEAFGVQTVGKAAEFPGLDLREIDEMVGKVGRWMKKNS